MWCIASCVLLATSALAGYVPYTGLQAQRSPQNYAPSGASYPIDFNDDLHINNPLIKPGSPIIFSFEQLRSNQPPQVDKREEDIGRYMYRPKPGTTTTTTTPEPTPEPIVVLDDADINVYNRPMYQTQPQPDANVWSNYMTQTAKNFASMVAKQNDFPLEMPDSSHIDPKTRYPEVDRWQQQPRTSPPPPPTPNWEEFADKMRYKPSQQIEQKQVSVPEVETKKEPSTAWGWTETPAIPTRQAPQNRQLMTNRGRHKFNWDDLALDMKSTPEISTASVTEPAPKTTTTSAPLDRRGPPPPVPTLSSWYGDNFGK